MLQMLFFAKIDTIFILGISIKNYKIVNLFLEFIFLFFVFLA